MPTLEEIELFQKGNLSASRTAEIKSLAATNPLVSEALEGFAILPVFAAVPGAESFLSMAANASADASGSAMASEVAAKTATWFGTKTLIFSAITATVIVAGTLFIINHNSSEKTAGKQPEITSIPENQLPAQNLTENLPTTSNTDVNGGSAQTTNNPSPEITGYSPLVGTEDNQTPLHNPSTEAAHASEPIAGDQNIVEKLAPIDPSTEKVLTPDSSSPDVVVNPINLVRKLNFVGIVSILHYHVADYTSMVAPNWKSFELDPGGVPAQYENEDEKRAAQHTDIIKEIPYLDYLSLCIQAMDQKEYGLAIEHFKTVLDQYPADVNALFYSAQCHYNQGNYDKALALYDKTLINMITKFNEEAEFYKAKSLRALGRTAEANALFEAIKAKGKFYSSQAAKELD